MIGDLAVFNPNDSVFLTLDDLPSHERNCVRGSIGTMYSRKLMTLALAHALKLDTYGA
jgi:AMMECR1 domain-containing protein